MKKMSNVWSSECGNAIHFSFFIKHNTTRNYLTHAPFLAITEINTNFWTWNVGPNSKSYLLVSFEYFIHQDESRDSWTNYTLVNCSIYLMIGGSRGNYNSIKYVIHKGKSMVYQNIRFSHCARVKMCDLDNEFPNDNVYVFRIKWCIRINIWQVSSSKVHISENKSWNKQIFHDRLKRQIHLNWYLCNWSYLSGCRPLLYQHNWSAIFVAI